MNKIKFTLLEEIPCYGCRGTGRIFNIFWNTKCKLCNGTGKIKDCVNVWPNSPFEKF